MQTQKISASTGATRPAPAPSTDAADAKRLGEQLAALAEEASNLEGETRHRAWIEFVRGLLGAQAVVLQPALGDLQWSGGVATTAGLSAADALAEAARLDGKPLPAAVECPRLGEGGTLLGVEAVREGRRIFRLSALLRLAQRRDAQAMIVLLQALAGFLLYSEARRAGARQDEVLSRMARLLELFRTAGSVEDEKAARQMAADEVADLLGCDRVVVSLRRRGKLRLMAVSRAEQVGEKGQWQRALGAAHEEALAAGVLVDFRNEAKGRGETLAHELLAKETSAERLLTVPLPGMAGAVTMEWGKTGPSGEEASRLADAAAPFVAALFSLLDRARPNRLFYHCRKWWRDSPANRRRVAVACAALVAGVLAFPIPYRIKTGCRVAPRIQRVLAAPFDATLRESAVRPGDKVGEGEVLAELDPRDFRLREAELAAAHERALKQRDRALRNEGEGTNFAEAQLAEFEARSIAEDLALVRGKIERLTLKAPLSGVIVAGDLRRALGQPVRQGQVLFEVAPIEDLLIEIEVPDRDVSRVREGQELRFRMDAFPGEAATSKIERIHPASEVRDGANIFLAEARVDAAALAARGIEMRPGMRGRAAVSTERRPVAWILGHRLVEWIVLEARW